MKARWLILLLLSILLMASRNLPPSSAGSPPVQQLATAPSGLTCDQLVTLAVTTVGVVCDNLGRNQACYGNKLVSVEFKPNVSENFSQSGDKIDLLSIQRIQTAPLNRVTSNWGIAVLKAQADLPDALPGQNVTFLLFGDASIDNPSPDMRAVTVQTRIGDLECTNAPESAVMIQAPEGSQVSMTINGADVILGSTAYITANPNTERMTFAILEGVGVISAEGVTRIIQPGMKTGIPLGGADGLQAAGPPSEPSAYDSTLIQNVPINLLDRQVVPPNPIEVVQPQPDASTATPTPEAACAPRTDWPYRYVIQVNDNLASIALKLNMRTADLQAGNCIADPNRLIAGQTIRVPRPVATATPVPTATFTASPVPQGMIGPNLRADSYSIMMGNCTTIRWDVDNIDSVYFEGMGVVGHGSEDVCPSMTTSYTLEVILKDGSHQNFFVTITVT
ncbi:MAG: LysM peptidoglycan-binding domain-containing protein [Chloroflexi bacterium]|nr:LysM peptidoglycan-binding domain-containing protein [Chloroflexota bacterium]